MIKINVRFVKGQNLIVKIVIFSGNKNFFECQFFSLTLVSLKSKHCD